MAADMLLRHGQAQLLDQSAEADAGGAGRGDDWPTGRIAELAPFLDLRRAAHDEATGEFNLEARRPELEAIFFEPCAAAFTTNGLAFPLWFPGVRGPASTAPVYLKGFNAGLMDQTIVVGRNRLVDQGSVTRLSPGAAVVERPGHVLVWHSTDLIRHMA